MTAAVLVRLGRAADVPRIAEIERASFGDPWPASAFDDALAAAPVVRLFVAEDATGMVAGYLLLRHVADEAEILNVAVSEAARRTGIGRQLLAAALASAGAAADVFLEVRASNVGAQALYRSSGFVEFGRRRGYYRGPVEDALVLRRPAGAVPPPQP